MRTAIARAKNSDAFAAQQNFDRAITKLVRATDVPPTIAEWFANEKLAEGTKRSIFRTVFHPAILATAFALAVIAVIAWLKFDEQVHAFPGLSVAKHLLAQASTTRIVDLPPVQAEAGAMGDFFLMKHRLNHYDVPEEFAQFLTTGARVYDDDEAGRVGQIAVSEKRMQYFLFPARRDSKSGQPEEFSGWRTLEQDGWSGAVRSKNGVIFMAVLRGPEKELAPYLKVPPSH